MISKQLNLSKPALALLLGLSVSTVTLAQTSVDGNLESSLDREYPELARLYDAFTVTHAAALDAIAKADMDPQFAQARAELRRQLEQRQDTDEMAHHGMVHGSDHSDSPSTDMNGPYRALDVQARVELDRMLRGDHTGTAAAEAYDNVAALPRHAAMVLAAGRQFQKQLWDLWADPGMSIDAKEQATQAVIEDYQTGDPMHAVSAQYKPVSLYLDHAYAGSLKSAYPRISGLLWSNQWLQLASLEAIIHGQVDPQFEGRVVGTLERYNNKLGSYSGMSMFPSPVEMPTVPTIAPTLYTLAPEASIIIDNLNMLDAAIADIIAYPDLDASTREQAIAEKVAQFTTEEIATDEMSYLLSALRGGIYNQGGPAIGELMGSERNRSRDAMGMQHHMSMSAPN
ncbi:MAG: hypothetical protein Q8L60_11295 [Gammaproteobacteria bacterium]|nr:hypothetical protein [Gammaproteobacteria bacterium]MDP2347056.1 hypothetical protein [Gammaproteobacteria bacterium]